jgi:superfamily II RNA helicase
MREDGQGATLALSNIGRVFSKTYRLEEKSLDEAFYDIHENKNPPLDEPKLSLHKGNSDEAEEILSRAIESLLHENLSEDARRRSVQLLWETWDDAEYLEKTDRDVEILRSEIWLPFEHRAKVLDYFGYLDFAAQKVTETGKWLADVRVDRPLLVGEALKHGLFEKLGTKHVAGVMAALAADSDRNYGELHLSNEILDVLSEFEEIVYEVSSAEWKFGVEPADEMNLSAAAAAERWADGMSWNDLVFQTKAEEGDLVRLLSRTGEALMQVAQLKNSNSRAAEIAHQTAEIILREPIR